MAGEFVIGNMVAKLAADTSDFIKDMTGASNTAKQFKKDAGQLEQSSKGIKGAFSGMSTAVQGFLAGGALASAGYALVNFLKDSVTEAEAAAKAQAQLEAVIKSTGGVAGVTAEDVNGLANELMGLTGVEDDLIVKNAAVMLTFTKVSEDVFPDAIEAALDMSAAMGQDLQSSIVQVGKALNDPIQGVGALRRVGVQLTDQQEELVKSLMATGKEAEAQAIILGELQTEFGGTAKAMHEAGAGSDDFANALGNLKESIGKGLIPLLGDANSGLSSYIATLTNRITVENDLVEALDRGIITQSDFNRQLYLVDWTSYNAAEAMLWLTGKTDEYKQSLTGSLEIEQIRAGVYNSVIPQIGELAASTNEVVEANKAAKKTTNEWIAELDTSIDSTIANWIEKLDFLEAGGGEIQAAFEAVKGALISGAITQSEADYFFRELYVADQALQVEMNKITMDQAAQNVANTLGVELGEALKLVKNVNKEAAKSITKTVTVNVKYSQAYLNFLNSHKAGGGPVTGGVGYVVGEAGPELFVPSVSGSIVPNSKLDSFGNDGGLGGASVGGTTIYEGDTVINNFNEQAAAINTAMLWNSRRARLSSRMG